MMKLRFEQYFSAEPLVNVRMRFSVSRLNIDFLVHVNTPFLLNERIGEVSWDQVNGNSIKENSRSCST